MESLESLKNRKRQAEYDLERITIKKHNSTAWAPGVQDQHKSESYSYNEYTDTSKAYRLIDEIKDLNRKIENYAKNAQAERERQEFIRESQIPKYGYTAGGKDMETKSQALAARYDAQHRFFAMGKIKQTMAKINGQYKKFQQLWNKAANQLNEQQQEKVTEELNKLFR